MNVLFVCTAGQQRSPTGVQVVKEFFPWHEAKFAGVHPFAEIPITREAVEWADIIFTMEKIHKDMIAEEFPYDLLDRKKIVVLGVPDIYYKGDPQLIEMLKKQLKDYLT